MKKIMLAVLAASLIIGSCTGCLEKKSDSTETPDTAVTVSGQCKFDIEDTVEEISDFAKDHGMKYSKRLCYRSDSHFKIDMTRISGKTEFTQIYEDAVYSIVSTGNLNGAEDIYYNVETVLLDDNGYFTVYLTYQFEYDSE